LVCICVLKRESENPESCFEVSASVVAPSRRALFC